MQYKRSNPESSCFTQSLFIYCIPAVDFGRTFISCTTYTLLVHDNNAVIAFLLGYTQVILRRDLFKEYDTRKARPISTV